VARKKPKKSKSAISISDPVELAKTYVKLGRDKSLNKLERLGRLNRAVGLLLAANVPYDDLSKEIKELETDIMQRGFRSVPKGTPLAETRFAGQGSTAALSQSKSDKFRRKLADPDYEKRALLQQLIKAREKLEAE